MDNEPGYSVKRHLHYLAKWMLHFVLKLMVPVYLVGFFAYWLKNKSAVDTFSEILASYLDNTFFKFGYLVLFFMLPICVIGSWLATLKHGVPNSNQN